ncbi:MAG: hypothetical protein ACR5LA_05195 [Wolbachia sp.]
MRKRGLFTGKKIRTYSKRLVTALSIASLMGYTAALALNISSLSLYCTIVSTMLSALSLYPFRGVARIQNNLHNILK